MSTTTSRRAVLAGSAATIVSPVAAVASQAGPDADLLRLWDEFKARTAAVDIAEAHFKPYSDLEWRFIRSDTYRLAASWDDSQRALEAFKRKHEPPGAWEALSVAWEAQSEAGEAILAIPATTLAGVAVKLCVVTPGGVGIEPAAEKYRDNVLSVLRDIDRLLGSDFAERSQIALDDDEEEAGQS